MFLQAAAVAYERAVETHPTHASILCKYGSFVKHIENDPEKVIGNRGPLLLITTGTIYRQRRHTILFVYHHASRCVNSINILIDTRT